MLALQRCILLVGILICYALSTIQAIDCQRFVYHPRCRGVQSKRSSFRGAANEQMLNDLFGITENSRGPSKPRNDVPTTYEKSKLLSALLDRGLNPDVVYDWYVSHADKNERRNEQKYSPDYLSEQRLFDDDY